MLTKVMMCVTVSSATDLCVGDKRCPVALRMICCQLLLEITAFLRECPQIFTRRKKNSSGHSARSASHISSMRTTSTRSDRDTDRLLSRRASHMHPSTSASPVFTGQLAHVVLCISLAVMLGI